MERKPDLPLVSGFRPVLKGVSKKKKKKNGDAGSSVFTVITEPAVGPRWSQKLTFTKTSESSLHP